ncbi:hypothetical protein JKP88DRAFT_82818 [Tribonema minus]|uniref:EF-hand domain-containing protein n=1 Tax=Tribonema minus TaxID=303371 RepID=A0A835YMB9_9STRA|nr:hypothetical protein JKP88DRAFT_82818 [Tribonema minus]
MLGRAEGLGLTPLKRQPTRVRHELTEEQKQEVREAFELFDTEQTGTLSLYEAKVLLRALGFPVRKHDVLRAFHAVDPHADGAAVTLSHLYEMALPHYAGLDPQEEMLKAFRLFDADASGKISVADLRRVARELGEGLSEDDLQAMVDEFDRDQDGQISKDEFLAIMQNSNAF